MPVSFVREGNLYKLTETCDNCGTSETSFREEYPSDIVHGWEHSNGEIFCRDCCLVKNISNKEGVHYVFF